MKKFIIFIILFCLATPVQGADVWGDLNVWGLLTAQGINQRLTFDSGSYIDGGTSGHLLFYGDDTDISFSLDTTDNTITGPEIYSLTHNIIGFRPPIRLLDTLTVSGLTTVIEQDITANFNMEVSTATTIGVLTKGGNRWLHDFDTGSPTFGENVFLGSNTGNPSGMTSGGIFEASYNVGIGLDTLTDLTSGYNNCALGAISLANVTTGSFNTGVGGNALTATLTGERNTAIGHFAGYQWGATPLILTNVNESVFIGSGTRAGFGVSLNEIVIGTDVIGHGSNTATFGNDDITDTHLKGVITLGDATNNCTLTVQPVATTCTGDTLATGSTLTELCILCN